MNRKPKLAAAVAELRHRAEARLKKQPGRPRAAGSSTRPLPATPQRLLHELQVHQVELEMQNAELQASRDRMEVLLEKYTDLYDFAPVGYFSLEEQGRILEVNLTGAALLGVERSRLIDRRLSRFVAAASRPDFQAFLGRVFAGAEKHVCEAALETEAGGRFWANIHGIGSSAARGPRKWCLVAVSDITSLKQAQATQRQLDALTVSNRELELEIIRRQTVEQALRQSEHRQRGLLDALRHLQEQLRHLSHKILRAQEEERKRISRELHDEITQTLVGINVHLDGLARLATVNPAALRRRIVRTQRLVEQSVDIVHRFARELRPTALDDLGLIATLHSFIRDFAKRTGLRVGLKAFAGVEQLSGNKRTVLYRVAHEALTNVAEHAHATRVTVSIRKLARTVQLDIRDDGKSFDVDQVLQAGRNKHLGLLGMRERLEMVGGHLNVESTPGRGTLLRAQVPLGAARRGGGGGQAGRPDTAFNQGEWKPRVHK
jgi:PAS domain S-box-containing protein